MLVQIVLFDGFDPLDVVAPFEVLAADADAAGAAPIGAAATASAATGDAATASAAATGAGLDVELVSVEGPREVVSGTRGLTLRATAASTTSAWMPSARPASTRCPPASSTTAT